MALTYNSDNGLYYDDQTGEWTSQGPAQSASLFDYSQLFAPGFEGFQFYFEQGYAGNNAIDTQAEFDYAKAHPFGENLVTSTPFEALTYWQAGVTNQQNLDAYAKEQAGESLSPLQTMLVDNPGVAGQSVVRPDIPNPYQGVADPLAGDNPAGVQDIYDGYGVTPKDYSSAASNWAANNTAAAQAARDDDSDLGVIGAVLTVAAAVFAPYAIPAIAAALEVSTIAAAAIFGAAKSIVTGALTGTGLDLESIAMGAATGAAGGAFGGVDAGYLSAADAAGGLVPEFGTNAAYDAAMGGALDTMGNPYQAPPIDPSMQFAQGGGRTDSPVYEATPTDPGYVGDLPDAAPPPVPAPAAPQAPGVPQVKAPEDYQWDLEIPGQGQMAEKPGLVDSVIKWAKENPTIATAAVGAIGTTVAGIGKGLIDQSTMEQKIQADKDLVAQKFQQDTEGKRQHVQSNTSLFNWRSRFKPTGKPLTRISTGQAVYSPEGGLVNSRMGG